MSNDIPPYRHPLTCKLFFFQLFLWFLQLSSLFCISLSILSLFTTRSPFLDIYSGMNKIALYYGTGFLYFLLVVLIISSKEFRYFWGHKKGYTNSFEQIKKIYHAVPSIWWYGVCWHETVTSTEKHYKSGKVEVVNTKRNTIITNKERRNFSNWLCIDESVLLESIMKKAKQFGRHYIELDLYSDWNASDQESYDDYRAQRHNFYNFISKYDVSHRFSDHYKLEGMKDILFIRADFEDQDPCCFGFWWFFLFTILGVSMIYLVYLRRYCMYCPYTFLKKINTHGNFKGTKSEEVYNANISYLNFLKEKAKMLKNKKRINVDSLQEELIKV